MTKNRDQSSNTGKATIPQLTDIMVSVKTLDGATFYKRQFGMEQVDAGPGYIVLRDKVTGQRLTLVDEPFGVPFALAFQTAGYRYGPLCQC